MKPQRQLTKALTAINGESPSVWVPERYIQNDQSIHLRDIEAAGGYLLILHTLDPETRPNVRTIIPGNKPSRLMHIGRFAVEGDTYDNVPTALVWDRHGRPCTDAASRGRGYRQALIEYPDYGTFVVSPNLLGVRSLHRGPFWPDIEASTLQLRSN